MRFWCSLCQVICLEPSIAMPEGSDEAVTIIDGNAACEEHWPLLQGRTVTDAYNCLVESQARMRR